MLWSLRIRVEELPMNPKQYKRLTKRSTTQTAMRRRAFTVRHLTLNPPEADSRPLPALSLAIHVGSVRLPPALSTRFAPVAAAVPPALTPVSQACNLFLTLLSL